MGEQTHGCRQQTPVPAINMRNVTRDGCQSDQTGFCAAGGPGWFLTRLFAPQMDLKGQEISETISRVEFLILKATFPAFLFSY